jgi:hypothetical protein
MSKKKRHQKALRRSRERIRVYLYGADREEAATCTASFAGGGCGGVVCGTT